MFKNKQLTNLANALSAYNGDEFWDNDELNTLNRLRTPTDTAPNAGVLVIISDEPTPRLALTVRSRHLKAHAGEVSLVGGKKDESDNTIADTALRECFEEIGLGAECLQLIGKLPKQLSKAGLIVAPFVAVVASEHFDKIRINDDEIARLFWVALDYLINNAPSDYQFVLDDKRQTHHKGEFDGIAVGTLSTPAWCVDNEVIWGMTGRILASLLWIGFGIKVDWYYRVKLH